MNGDRSSVVKVRVLLAKLRDFFGKSKQEADVLPGPAERLQRQSVEVTDRALKVLQFARELAREQSSVLGQAAAELDGALEDGNVRASKRREFGKGLSSVRSHFSDPGSQVRVVVEVHLGSVVPSGGER